MNGGEGFLEEEEALRGDNNLLPFSSSYSPSSSSSAAGGGPHTRLELMVDSSSNNNNNNEHGCCGRVSTAEEVAAVEKEHMFDKVVTPSDVGKLNRLVIPKQHAEKYFPLDSSSNEKGLLLNFEDKTGKPWRFRYSYWNSSQSYVMTKGWSRFVKDKKLDAGDVVSFHRGLAEDAKDRLYIDWRRRPDAPPPPNHAMFHRGGFGMMPSYPWSPLLMRSPPNSYSSSMPQLNYNMNIHPYRSGGEYGRGGGGGYGYENVVNMNTNMNPIYYMRSDGRELGSGTSNATYHHQHQQVGVQVNVVEPGMVLESVPMVSVPVAAGKRLRLFGVNMDCAAVVANNRDKSTSDKEYEVLSSSTSTSNAMTASQTPVEFRLYDDGGATTPATTTDFFNRAGKASSSNTTTSSTS